MCFHVKRLNNIDLAYTLGKNSYLCFPLLTFTAVMMKSNKRDEELKSNKNSCIMAFIESNKG